MATSAENPLCQTRTEILRAAKLCAPGLEALGQGTFDGDPTKATDVLRWRDTVFLPLLAPAVNETTIAFKLGCRELVTVDASLDKRLAGPLSKASRASGRTVALSLNAPNSEATLKKFLAAVSAGSTPGHMAVVFAARASVFHFPTRIVAGALVLLEMRTAPVDAVWTAVESCLEALPATQSSLRAA